MIQDLTDEVLEQVAGFARTHPSVRFEVTIGNSAELASALSKGALDVALLAGTPGAATPLFRREDLVWIGKDGMVLSQEDPIPLVLCAAPCGVRNRAIDALDNAGISWRLAFSSPSIAGLKAAVRAGLGITLRGRSLLDRGLAQLDGQPKLPETQPLEIVLASNLHASPAALAFARFVATLGAVPGEPFPTSADTQSSTQDDGSAIRPCNEVAVRAASSVP